MWQCVLGVFAKPDVHKLAAEPRAVKSVSGRGFARNVDRYRFERLLGGGPHTHVAMVRRKGGVAKDRLVLKTLMRSRGDEARLRREATALVSCHTHPHIVACLDIMQDTDHIYLVTERCELGDVHKAFAGRQDELSEQQVLFLFRQLVDAVVHMHAKGIAHRDIKPENVVLRSLKHLLLCDFGSVSCGNGDSRNHKCSDLAGTLCYMAPEMLVCYNGHECEYDPYALDVWGCGIVLHYMLRGTDLFANNANVAQKIAAHRLPLPPIPGVSRETNFLLNRMLDPSPRRRITMSKLASSLEFARGSPAAPSGPAHPHYVSM